MACTWHGARMSLDAWSDFIVAQVGASSALLGLLFVGVSLNLTKILAASSLPSRALVAMTLLVAILLMSTLLLIPAQPALVIGAEILAVGTAAWLLGTVLEVRKMNLDISVVSKSNRVINFIIFEFATLPYIVAGLMLLSGNANGLYWFSAAVVISLLKVVIDAWVLLIEINR